MVIILVLCRRHKRTRQRQARASRSRQAEIQRENVAQLRSMAASQRFGLPNSTGKILFSRRRLFLLISDIASTTKR